MSGLRERLTTEQFSRLEYVLMKNQGVCTRGKSDLGCTNLVEHRIDLEPDAVPWREEARRLAPFKAEKSKEEIEHLLSLELSDSAYSPWACGIVMAKKKRQPIKVLLRFQTSKCGHIERCVPNIKDR